MNPIPYLFETSPENTFLTIPLLYLVLQIRFHLQSPAICHINYDEYFLQIAFFPLYSEYIENQSLLIQLQDNVDTKKQLQKNMYPVYQYLDVPHII